MEHLSQLVPIQTGNLTIGDEFLLRFGANIRRKLTDINPYNSQLSWEASGRLPFVQKFRGKFPEISMGKWYSLFFPLWKTIIVRLEYFNDF